MEQSIKRKLRRRNNQRLAEILESSSEEEQESISELADMEKVVEDSDDDNMQVDSSEDIKSDGESFYNSFESSESELESEPEPNPQDNSLISDLAGWATKHRLSRESVNDLLQILIKNQLDVPKDSRTLLKTPRSVHEHISKRCGGTWE